MKAEQILDALGGIDDCFLEELLVPEGKLLRQRKVRLFFLIAAILAVLTACSVKVAQIWEDGWFERFFSEEGHGEAVGILNEKQMELLDKGMVQAGQRISCDGYTVVLESALSDGYRAFAKFAVEAPEGTVLGAQKYYLNLRYEICHEDGQKVKTPVRTVGVRFLEDKDPDDNRVTMLMEALLQTQADSGQLLEKGMIWTIELYDFGVDHGLGNQEVLLRIDQSMYVTFDEENLLQQEMEVLRRPVWCPAERGIWQWYFPARVKVISFRVRALSATLTYEEPLLGYGTFGMRMDPVYVVLKDGTKLEAHSSMGGNHGGTWEESLEFPFPVLPSDIDYIELPRSKKIKVMHDMDMAVKEE